MKIRPFKGIRPVPEHVKRIACRPYDVLNSTEAREELNANPETFLQVVKPEITLPEEIDHYDERVYQAADQNFKELVRKGIFRDQHTGRRVLNWYEEPCDGGFERDERRATGLRADWKRQNPHAFRPPRMGTGCNI